MPYAHTERFRICAFQFPRWKIDEIHWNTLKYLPFVHLIPLKLHSWRSSTRILSSHCLQVSGASLHFSRSGCSQVGPEERLASFSMEQKSYRCLGQKLVFKKCKYLQGSSWAGDYIETLIIQLRRNYVIIFFSSCLIFLPYFRLSPRIEQQTLWSQIWLLRFSMVFGYALWSHVYVHFFRVCVCGSPSLFLLLLGHGFPVRCQRMGTTLSNGGCEPWQFGPIMTNQSPGSHSTWVLLFQ